MATDVGGAGGDVGPVPVAVPTPVPADQPYRMLPIAANLLPEEIVALRRVRRYRLIVIVSLAVLVAGLASWYGVARYQTSQASSDLARAESDIGRLTRQQTSFTELIRVQAESQTIKSQLAVLMAEDLQWSSLVGSLAEAAPEGVAITGMTASLVSAAGGAAAAGVGGLPRGSAKKTVGTVSIKATATSKAAIAEYVDALSRVKGLASPLLGDMNLQEGSLNFTVRIEITSDVLGGRYGANRDREAGEG